MSSWVINGMPAGICFREDTNKVTNNNSEFLPHLVNLTKERSYVFKQSQWQKDVRILLYGNVDGMHNNIYDD